MHLHISDMVYCVSHPAEIVECYWLFNGTYASYDRDETGEFNPEESRRLASKMGGGAKTEGRTLN